MGKIEESIMDNYKQALNEGNLSQASKAVNLAKNLKDLIEKESFLDYTGHTKSSSTVIGNVFEPFSYKYNPDSALVIILDATIFLTDMENKLFYFLTQNESYDGNIKVVKKIEIKSFLWPNTPITDNAIRVLIKRLRQKIEPDPSYPQVLISFNGKGYVFVAKQES